VTQASHAKKRVNAQSHPYRPIGAPRPGRKAADPQREKREMGRAEDPDVGCKGGTREKGASHFLSRRAGTKHQKFRSGGKKSRGGGRGRADRNRVAACPERILLTLRRGSGIVFGGLSTWSEVGPCQGGLHRIGPGDDRGAGERGEGDEDNARLDHEKTRGKGEGGLLERTNARGGRKSARMCTVPRHQIERSPSPISLNLRPLADQEQGGRKLK